ncbi:MAG: hypothetical protein R2854_16570 [Caldilineaceae bacterium]
MAQMHSCFLLWLSSIDRYLALHDGGVAMLAPTSAADFVLHEGSRSVQTSCSPIRPVAYCLELNQRALFVETPPRST